MVTSVNGSKAPNIFAAPTTQQETPSESTASFTDQLSSALEGPPGKGSAVQTPQSQDSGVRQFLGAVVEPSKPTPAAPRPERSRYRRAHGHYEWRALG